MYARQEEKTEFVPVYLVFESQEEINEFFNSLASLPEKKITPAINEALDVLQTFVVE